MPTLSMWTLYARPLDFPGHFVVRRYDFLVGGGVTVPAPVACLYPTLDDAFRDFESRAFLARDPNDDPVIVGVWL